MIHAPIPTRPVTEADISRYWDDELADAQGRTVEILKRARDWMVFPEAFPAFSSLLSDDRGRVWAEIYPLLHADERRWLVFEAGRAVGEVRVPAAFRVMAVGEDHLAGVWTDDLGVEFVRIYRLDEG